jgi:hypothetical protein
MTLITEVAHKIYEIKPEGKGLDRFPLCTAYLVVDEKIALIEAGCPVHSYPCSWRPRWRGRQSGTTDVPDECGGPAKSG